MIRKTIYCCEFCDNKFYEQSGCENCEASHFNLNRREYLDWRILNKDAASAGKMRGVCNDDRTRKVFDDAVRKLVDFENRHGLENVIRKPKDFFI